jgi:hypothetical protein
MLLDSRLVPQTIISPRSFVGLMSVYESNYLRLLNLIPDLERIDGCFRSRVAGDCDLHVEILERTRYTLTLTLTYYFQTDDGRLADPDMLVRLPRRPPGRSGAPRPQTPAHGVPALATRTTARARRALGA